MSDDKTNETPNNAGKSKASDPLKDDAKTYENRNCPLCGMPVKIRTYPRATDRRELEKYPTHKDRNGYACSVGGWTMRQAISIFGVSATGEK